MSGSLDGAEAEAGFTSITVSKNIGWNLSVLITQVYTLEFEMFLKFASCKLGVQFYQNSKILRLQVQTLELK